MRQAEREEEKKEISEIVQEIVRRCKEQDVLADYIGGEEAIEALYRMLEQDLAVKSMRREDREEGKE